MSFLAAGACDFNVRGLPLTGADAAVDDLASMEPDLSTPLDAAPDLTMTPPDLTPPPPDLAGCGLCVNGCAPCCNDVFPAGMTATTSCNGTACTDCEQRCGKNVGTCNLNCSTGATCYGIVDQSSSAHANCTGGSTCHLTCSKVNGNPGCTVDCTGDSHCILSCKMSTCSFSSCSGIGGAMTCPSGDIVCNAACP